MSTFHIFSGKKVLLPGLDEPVPASIRVNTSTGKIDAITQGRYRRSEFTDTDRGWIDADDAHWTDAGENVIIPGLIDTHVHMNEPGRTDWEGFNTGTRAAVSGGVTTVVDMPLDCLPPTTTVENFRQKLDAAEGQCWSDVAFWGGVIPNNELHLAGLVEAGVKGFKCFLIDSGVEEFPCVTEKDLWKAMEQLHNHPSTVLLCHAELELEPAGAKDKSAADCTLYSTFLESRPEKLEYDAISLITRLQKEFPKLRCHIVHLSASSALPLIREAKRTGLKLTVETCFHYLFLSLDDIPNGRTEFKCCPPIRDQANREELWAALKDGTIDCVVSDHSPCAAGLKKLDDGDFMGAWGGISTLGLGLSLLWTEGQKRGISLGTILKWTSERTAKLAGLDGKGGIRVGSDADFVIWNPDAEFTVVRDLLEFKNKISPYLGLTLRGQVQKTFVRGQLVFDVHEGFASHAAGRLLAV